MSDSQRLLEFIDEGIVAHGGDLGGWTNLDDELLKLFDGRVTLTAEITDDPDQAEGLVHAHVLTKLHDYDDEVLDACLFGMGDNRENALREASIIWITCVAGPIRSFLDNKPVCMTCQAGVADGDINEGYSPDDYGLPNLRAYVGPSIARGFDDDRFQSEMDASKPWFRYAAESAAPRRVHMAKASVFAQGEEGWRRELEIDGHDVSHRDPTWPADQQGPEFGYFTRFAVFEFPQNSHLLQQRAELERTIEHFGKQYSKFDDVDQLMETMEAEGFDPDMVKQAESMSSLAFGRMFFEGYGVQYSPYIIRARSDDRVETNVPLMSLPAYSRARALAPKLAEELSEDEFRNLCFYSAESGGILQFLEANGDQEIDWGAMTFYPCVVPDRNTSVETMERAMAELERMQGNSRSKPAKEQRPEKPWWKFW
ncbi:hypothetical protein [Aeoliella sp.]|uniref:hypothetical protein n=1 Tax=Aeoliella sp. TaxID=2795800 RepID=UPI003CCC0E4D